MNYLEKAAIARRIKARIFGPRASKQKVAVTASGAEKHRPDPHSSTRAFSVVHRIHMNLLPVTAPSTRAAVNPRALDDVCEDAA